MNQIISDQFDWKELTDLISEGSVTPVIGNEMYKFNSGNEQLPIDSYLSKKIFELYKITDEPAVSLTDSVSYLENEKKIKTRDIIIRLKSIINEVNYELPLLTDLVKIQGLKYYINTTVYNELLEKKIQQIKNQKVSSINFSLAGPFEDSKALVNLADPFVFNVFGSLLSTNDPAISEEDMLEYAGNFNEKMKKASNLVDALKNKTLLFLGCSYPEWMMRFALRLLSNQPMHQWGTDNRIIIVVNDKSAYRDQQYEILKNYDVHMYEGNTGDFVRELTEQWKSKSAKFEKTKSIFLSYTRDDREAVENLKQSLEKIGKEVDCFYDIRSLKPADIWKNEIIASIRKADIFIPLISVNSLDHEDGFVQKEWSMGDTEWRWRNQEKREGKYLVPVVIDDSKLYGDKISKFFDSNINITKMPGGNPDEEFINEIKKILNLV